MFRFAVVQQLEHRKSELVHVSEQLNYEYPVAEEIKETRQKEFEKGETGYLKMIIAIKYYPKGLHNSYDYDYINYGKTIIAWKLIENIEVKERLGTPFQNGFEFTKWTKWEECKIETDEKDDYQPYTELEKLIYGELIHSKPEEQYCDIAKRIAIQTTSQLKNEKGRKKE